MALTYKPEPTVRPYENFNAAEDGTALREAMKGFGTNEDPIIEILTNRCNSQRQLISKFFTEEYGRNLIEDLKSELGGHFEDLIVALMIPPVDYLCKQLHKAMKGLGSDDHCLIEILCSHSNKEVQEIVEAYERLYDRPLAEHMCSETSGDFRRLLTLIVTGVRKDSTHVDPSRARELAEKLYASGEILLLAWKGKGIVIMLSRFYTSGMTTIQRRLKQGGTVNVKKPNVIINYNMSMGGVDKADQFVKDDQPPNRERAAIAAQEILDAGEGKLGTDEEVFNKIFAHECFPQLKLIFEEYKNIAGRTIEQAIKNELSGSLKEAMLAIVECVQHPPTFFAKRLHSAMAGIGTDDTTLIRIVVSRSEIDLENIKQEYERLYEKTLESAVRGETHGHYKKALLSLIRSRI